MAQVLNNSNWVEWRGVKPAGIQRSNIVVAAADYDAPDWIGASVAAQQYNFSASQNFFLKKLPTKPTDATFMLCIKYRTGEEVTRYRLWNDDNFVAGEQVAPLYNFQVIKKNFCLEVWSLQGEASITQTAISLVTTLKTVPDDVRDVDDVSLEPSVTLEFADLQSTTVLAKSPVAGMNIWLDAGDSYTITKDGSDLVAEWNSVAPELATLVQGTDANKPTWFGAGLGGPGDLPYLLFNHLDNVRNLVSTEQLTINSFFMVFAISGVTTNNLIVQGGASLIKQLSSVNTSFRVGSSIASITSAVLDTWYILRVDRNADGSALNCQLYSFAALLQTNGALDTVTEDYLTLGDAAVGATFGVGEFVGYPDRLSAADGDAVVAYLQQKYSGSAPATSGLTFNTNVAWLDND